MQVKLSRHLCPEGICLHSALSGPYEQEFPVTKSLLLNGRTTVTFWFGFNFSSHGTYGGSEIPPPLPGGFLF